MLGRGVKRKRSRVELPAMAGDEKRRREDAAESSWAGDVRQRVLGLGLEKLRSSRSGAELSLRRSVLLINTLRLIRHDMRDENPRGPPDSPLLSNDLTCRGCEEAGPESAARPETLVQEAFFGAFSDAVNAVSYLADLAPDDIFEDIDTSMYESSDFSAGWTLWPLGMSVWADQDEKSPASGRQSCAMDMNELDHIMEILVKS
nr:SERTA domain-containing protein 1-like [Nerophis lumbriciformis]